MKKKVFIVIVGILIIVWAGFYSNKRKNEEIIFVMEIEMARGVGEASPYTNLKIGFLNKRDRAIFYIPAQFEKFLLFPEAKHENWPENIPFPDNYIYVE